MDDAAELVRLRGVLMGVLTDGTANGWQESSRRILRRRLAEAAPTMAGFVVDASDSTGHASEGGGRLAACAVGVVEERLGAPRNPQGLTGYVFNVATDPGHRRHGHARACTVALLDWFRSQGVGPVDLRATAEAEPLYASLGFERTDDPWMRATLIAG